MVIFMEITIICILSILAVIGIDCIVKNVVRRFVYASPPVPCVNIFTYNNENDVEYTVRSALNNYPDSEITIYDSGSTDDTKKILKMLARDYSNVKIKTESV